MSSSGQLGEAPDAVADTLPTGATALPDVEAEDEEEDVGAMAARLDALRS